MLKKLRSSYIARVRELIESGLTDEETGKILGGYSCDAIRAFCYRHKIKATIKSGNPPYREPEQALQPISAYEENGIIITVYPALWANGVSPQKTVRPHCSPQSITTGLTDERFEAICKA